MNKVLTISIAAYNMEKYISQTLNSLLDERIIDELEIFVVDDGGQDHTLDIAREYASLFPQSIFPVHKENGGYGTTVNYSIAHASGRYFKCLDGDDWFDRDGLYQLVNVLRSSEEDVIVSPYSQGSSKESLKQKNIAWPSEIKNRKITEISKSGLRFGMWTLTFKTTVLRKSGVCLPERMLYTDVLYATIPFAYAKTIYYLDHGVYCYRLGRDGQSVSRESRIKHIQDVLDHCETMFRFYETQKETGCETIEYIGNRAASYYCRSAIRYLLLPKPSREGLQRIISYEKKMESISPELFSQTKYMGKIGLFMRMCRCTAYLPYWLLKVIPGGMPNWT